MCTFSDLQKGILFTVFGDIMFPVNLNILRRLLSYHCATYVSCCVWFDGALSWPCYLGSVTVNLRAFTSKQIKSFPHPNPSLDRDIKELPRFTLVADQGCGIAFRVSRKALWAHNLPCPVPSHRSTLTESLSRPSGLSFGGKKMAGF